MQKINATALGLALGICWGASIVITTLWINIVGGEEILAFLSKFYIGYSVSLLGALVGLIYGFIDGFIYGFFLAWFYNLFAARFGGSEPAAAQ